MLSVKAKKDVFADASFFVNFTLHFISMEQTSSQYDHILEICLDIFSKKATDYGTAWRILRPSSLTDQLFIKANRIRTLEIKKVSKVGENIRDEFVAIVNYSIMGLIQLEKGHADEADLSAKEASEMYHKYFLEAKELMLKKNHDYGEAWRSMRTSSLTDMILQKLYRTKQIEDNKGETIISEGIDANYFDMINYAVFALIKIEFADS